MAILDDILESIEEATKLEQETPVILDESNTLVIDAKRLEPLIKKFSFLSKNRQLEDQLVKVYCINNNLFAFADNTRYFYSTMINNVVMSENQFTFNIPYKQLSVIIKAALKAKSDLTFKITDMINIKTNKSSWNISMIDSKFDLDTVIELYSIIDYTDEILKEDLLDMLKMYLPFVSLTDDTLAIDNGNIFCRSNHFYIWSDIPLVDSYILSKDNIKLISTLKDSASPSIRLYNNDNKLIINCGDEIIVFDRIYDEQHLLKEITDLKRRQSVALLKTKLIDALNEINIYTTKDLSIVFTPTEIKLTNRTDNKGVAETKLDVNQELLNITEVESYNISFNILEECVKCIKEEVMEIITLNRTEYLQFRTPTINCIIMVNY